MTDTRETQALLAAVRAARQRQRDVDAAQQLETRRQMARRNRVAARFQDRALRKALAAAGVDYAEIQKRQAQDEKAIRKLVAEQRRATSAHAKRTARIQARSLASLAERLTTAQDWAPETLLLPRAVRIDSTLESSSPGASIAWKSHQLSDWRNVAKVALMAYSDDGFEWAQLRLAFDFLWFADRDGLLFAGSTIRMRGQRILYVKPACTGNLSATAAVHGRIGLWSYDASGRPQTMTGPYRDLGHNSLEGADSSGKLAYETIDTEESFPVGLGVGAPWITITKGKPVVVSAEIFAFTYAYRGLAELRFNGPHEIDVPFIRLVV